MLRDRLRSDIRTAAVLLCCMGAWLGILAALLPGCPVRVDPPTEEVCPSRPNCGQCASEAVCVWCPGSGRCIGRSAGAEACDIETVVSLPEACEVPEEAR